MARVNEVRRSGTISNVAPQASGAGVGWAALSKLAQIGADFMQPLADEKAQEAGYNAVYRDADGTLKVDKANVLGGRSAEIQNAAAYSKFLSQRRIDMQETYAELAQRHEFDPAGFKEAADAYSALLAKEDMPAALKEELLTSARSEASRTFNGLFQSATDRNYRESERNTRAHRDMIADDYVSLYMMGEFDEAEKKLAELSQLSAFRVSAPYITETQAESDAYLRGIRGSAKIAYITQRLTGETFSPELRREAEELLKDPDISPDARRKLDTAVTAAIKGVDGKAIADGLASDNYTAKVRRAESGGKATAKNPLSSAYGPYQFTRGTWAENVRELQSQGGAEWAKGLSEAQMQAMRADPAAAEEVFRHFRQKNAATLANAGLPVTEGTEYLAHFLGAGGAVTLLSADPNAKAADVLAKAIPGFSEANPTMADMTVGEMMNWANRKMTVKASDIAASQAALYQIEDEEVRAIASKELSRMYDMRRTMETESLLDYQTRIVEGDNLTETEIRNDQSLSDAGQNQLIKELRTARKDQTLIAQTISDLNSGAAFNIYENDDRKRIDKTFEASLGGKPAMSPEGQASAADITMRSGIMPETMFKSVRGAMTGNDPAAFAQAAEFTNQLLQRQPNAMSAYGGREDVQSRLSDYAFYSEFQSPEEAAARVLENNTPEAQAKRKNLSDAAKDAAKGLKPGDITSFFADKGFSATLGNEGQQAGLMEDYDRLFRDAFVSTGDPELAKNRALTEMSRIYGPNMVTGDSRIMKYPPQSLYPADVNAPRGEEFAWMTRQVVGEVTDLLGPEGFVGGALTALARGLALDPTLEAGADPAGIRLVSDEITRRDVSSGKAPSYVLYYTDRDGATQMAPQRFFFDPSGINQDAGARDRMNDQRSMEEAATNRRLWKEHFRTMGYSEGEAMRAVEQNHNEFGLAPPDALSQ